MNPLCIPLIIMYLTNKYKEIIGKFVVKLQLFSLQK